MINPKLMCALFDWAREKAMAARSPLKIQNIETGCWSTYSDECLE